jgi:hypothetical protein
MRSQRHNARARQRQHIGQSSPLARLELLWLSAPAALRIGLPLLAVLGLAFALTFAQTPTAQGSHARIALAPPNVPDVGNWQDEPDQTAFSIRIHGATVPARGKVPVAPAGQYSFTVPGSDQILGVARLTTQDNGDFIATSGAGQVSLASVATTACQRAQLVGAKPGDVAAILAAHFDAHALVAFAQLRYLPLILNTDGAITNLDEVNAFCAGKSNATTYTMAAGCDASGKCADPVTNAPQEVSQYENNLVTASKDPSLANWGPVYNASSTVARGQYTQEQFAGAMTSSLKNVGTIIAITPDSSPIQVQVASTGQAYFVVHDKVTFSLNGETTTRDVASYYLLENSQWHFWFSA